MVATQPTWWEGNLGKFIRDAYAALIPAILLLVWNWAMTVQIPAKDSPVWLSVGFILVRSCDRQVRKWIEGQKSKSL